MQILRMQFKQKKKLIKKGGRSQDAPVHPYNPEEEDDDDQDFMDP